jgi:8-oxo-dGTP diphosphatase
MIQTLEPELGNKLNRSEIDHVPLRVHKVQPAGGTTAAAKQRPRLGCAGLIRRGDEVLMGQRNKEPNRGLWVLPGGGVEFGESFAQTLERETLEEAGIDVAVRGVFKVYELINPPDEHRVIVYMIADYRSGEPVASSDLSDVRFFQKEELQAMSKHQMISPFVEVVLRDAKLI